MRRSTSAGATSHFSNLNTIHNNFTSNDMFLYCPSMVLDTVSLCPRCCVCFVPGATGHPSFPDARACLGPQGVEVLHWRCKCGGLYVFVVQVLSKGKVEAFGVARTADRVQQSRYLLRLQVKPEMTPSIRLLVYYFADDGELVADSLWLEVEGGCVNGLRVCVHTRTRTHTRTHAHAHTQIMLQNNVCVFVSVCVCVCVCRLRCPKGDKITGPSPTSCWTCQPITMDSSLSLLWIRPPFPCNATAKTPSAR